MREFFTTQPDTGVSGSSACISEGLLDCCVTLNRRRMQAASAAGTAHAAGHPSAQPLSSAALPPQPAPLCAPLPWHRPPDSQGPQALQLPADQFRRVQSLR